MKIFYTYSLITLFVLIQAPFLYAQKAEETTSETDTTKVDANSVMEETVKNLFGMSLQELMNVSVSVGSKTISTTEETPGSIYQITRKDIERTNAHNLMELLNFFIPGMDAHSAYIKNGNSATSFYNRGVPSDFNQQVLILWNGENKFNDATFGSPHIMVEYPLDNVERVEVNTSSPSPLFGGSAMITINIVTLDKSQEGTMARVNTGFTEEGFVSKKLSANFGKKLGSWRMGGAAQYFDDRGNELNNDSIPRHNIRNGNKGSVSLQLNVQNTVKGVEFGTSFRNINKDAFLSSLTPSESSDLYKYQTISWMSYLNYKPIQGLEMSIGYTNSVFNNYVDHEQFLPFGVNQKEKIPYGIQIKTHSFYAQSNYLKKFKALGGDHTLLTGVRYEMEGQFDHKLEVLNEDYVFEDQTEFRKKEFGVNIPNLSRNVYTAFVEDNWRFSEKTSALIALRGDTYDNYNGKLLFGFTQRLGLVYKPFDKWFFKMLVATAVRPPSIYELSGSKFLPSLYGNDNTKLETIFIPELNAVYKSQKSQLTITAYTSQISQSIAYIPSSIDTTISISQNEDEINLLGGEINWHYNINKHLDMVINGSTLISRYNSTREDVPYIPNSYLNFGVFYKIQKFEISPMVNYRGARKLEDFITINQEELQAPRYNVNLLLRYHAIENGFLYIHGKNLLGDNQYVVLSKNGYYFNNSVRNIQVGFQYKF